MEQAATNPTTTNAPNPPSPQPIKLRLRLAVNIKGLVDQTPGADFPIQVPLLLDEDVLDRPVLLLVGLARVLAEEWTVPQLVGALRFEVYPGLSFAFARRDRRTTPVLLLLLIHFDFDALPHVMALGDALVAVHALQGLCIHLEELSRHALRRGRARGRRVAALSLLGIFEVQTVGNARGPEHERDSGGGRGHAGETAAAQEFAMPVEASFQGALGEEQLGSTHRLLLLILFLFMLLGL